MISNFWISNVRIVLPGKGILEGAVEVMDGTVQRVLAAPAAGGAPIVDGGGRLLTPGMVDLHTHGLHRFMYENGAADVLEIAKVLPSLGTTCVLPTLIPRPGDAFLATVQEVAEVLDQVTEVHMPGLHLEGPFVTLTGAACMPLAGDLAYLKELLAAAGGRVRAMSVSPDAPNIIPVIEHLTSLGIASFMTHTRASVEQTEAAIEAGARHATHFYNVFPIPEEQECGVRQVGAVEAILADDRVSVDFIADGCHVPPVAIRAALAAKGTGRTALITDSNIGAGMPAGVYPTTWGYPVRVRPDDAARIEQPGHRYHGCLAGSALTMDRGMRNLMRWLRLPPEQVWQMATATPARIAGLSGKGSLAAGSDADLVLWNDDLTAAATWVSGRLVYERKDVHEQLHV